MLLPDLHDWEIKSIETDRIERNVILNIWFPPDGSSANLVFKGVSKFRASEFLLQNVILDLTVFDTPIDSDDLDYCKKVLHIDNSYFSSDGGVKLVYIEPSVGVELICGCTNIEFLEFNS